MQRSFLPIIFFYISQKKENNIGIENKMGWENDDKAFIGELFLKKTQIRPYHMDSLHQQLWITVAVDVRCVHHSRFVSLMVLTESSSCLCQVILAWGYSCLNLSHFILTLCSIWDHRRMQRELWVRTKLALNAEWCDDA